MKLQNLFIAAAVLFSTTVINAQEDTHEASHNVTIGIPNVALLDIESTTNINEITLGAEETEEAGNALNFGQEDSSLWINYSSIVSGDVEREVTVKITEGNVPDGLDLTVTAAAAVNGKGTTGLADVTTSFTLNGGAAHTIINGIGSAYTGDGAGNGHNLTYKISQSAGADSYSALRSDQSKTLTILYTLSDIQTNN